MSRLRLRGIGAVALGIALVASCRTGPAPNPPSPVAPPAPSSGPTSTAPLAAPKDAAAVQPVTSDAAPQSEVPDAAANPVAVSAISRPDPGPGKLSCGDATCKAVKELCAPREECVDRRDMACVPAAALEARKYRSAACTDGCFGWFDQKACDGPGDCKTGEVCCFDSDLIIGPCDDGENGMLDVYECKRASSKRTPCGTAEVCSSKDPRCLRPGSTCVVDAKSGLGTCVVPRPAFNCGAAPCASGLHCVESRTDHTKSCVKDLPALDVAISIECDRGRDCAPDEVCFESPSGRRCDLSAISWAGQDLPICQDASDCVGVCGQGNAVCYEPAPGSSKYCECRPPCKRAGDCKKSDYCSGLSLNRYGGALMKLDPFCDTGRQRCDCREPAQP